MKFLFSTFVMVLLALSVLSCSHGIVDDDGDQPGEICDTLTYTDLDDVAITPDFKSMTFYVYDDSIGLAVELWEPHDSTNYPSDYMFYVYLYATNREVISFHLHNFYIRRDPGADGWFEVTLTEGDITWTDDKTARIVYDRSLMPDFDAKAVWAYSMGSKDRMPDNAAWYITDSLSAE